MTHDVAIREAVRDIENVQYSWQIRLRRQPGLIQPLLLLIIVHDLHLFLDRARIELDVCAICAVPLKDLPALQDGQRGGETVRRGLVVTRRCRPVQNPTVL